MIYSFHKNGAGRILGVESSVGADCEVDKDSIVEGRSFVSHKSSIVRSGIKDSTACFSDINDSAVIDSHVSASMVSHSALQDVVIRGFQDRGSVVQNCLLTEVAVEGCTIRNVELNGPYHLHADCNETPKHRLLETENGVRQGLLMCSEDRFHLGCRCETFEHWDKNEMLLRRYFVGKLGWPLPSFDSIRETFEQWRSQR